MNKTFLFSLYEEAVRVSKPKHCLPDYFSTFSKGERVCILGAGKAAADMAVEAAEHFDRMALDVIGHRPAQVLLLHENDVAALATDEMVAALREAGWTIISPDEAYQDETLAPDPDTLFSGMGRVASRAFEAGKTGADYLDHWSADEAGIDARLDAAGVFTP